MSSLAPSFKHVSTVFSQVEYKRQNVLPSQFEVPLRVELKLVDNPDLPKRLQINLGVQCDDSNPVSFLLVAVGLFDYTQTPDNPTKQQKIDFLRQSGLSIVWPTMLRMIHFLNLETGTSQLKISPSIDFPIDELEKLYLAKE